MALCIVASAGFAQEPVAKVRAHFEMKGEPLVGQNVSLVVELLAPGFFSGNAAYTLPNVPGVLLIPPAGSPLIGSEEENGTTYTVQRHELYLFARRAGTHEIPPVKIRVQFKRNPLDKEPVLQTVQTPPLSFTAKQPPGAENLTGIICARGLKMTETWTPNSLKAKTGDAFTRTVDFSAPDVPAMAFPEFPTAKIDGLGIYPKPPEVLDQADRGSLLGRRRDSLIYICEKPGRFVIPAAKLTWWDLEAQELRTENFPSRVIMVALNPALTTSKTTSPSVPIRKELAQWLAMIALLAIAILFARKIPFARIWQYTIAPFRPVRLQPLNPGSQKG